MVRWRTRDSLSHVSQLSDSKQNQGVSQTFLLFQILMVENFESCLCKVRINTTKTLHLIFIYRKLLRCSKIGGQAFLQLPRIFMRWALKSKLNSIMTHELRRKAENYRFFIRFRLVFWLEKLVRCVTCIEASSCILKITINFSLLLPIP